MKTFHILLTLIFALCLAGCRDSSSSQGQIESGSATSRYTEVPRDASGYSNTIPASPAAAETREGKTYSIYVEGPQTGDVIAFTVFEPSVFTGGEKYPLLLYGHGGGDSRATDRNNPALVYSPFNDNIKLFLDNGYGVVSMDQRGHGESGGTIRVMDPDYEGLNLIAILNWVEANLDWLAYGPSVDGSDPNNLLLGAIGASYGGGFQLLLNNIDPQRRLDAIVPESTWYDMRNSIMPNGVAKSTWGSFLLLSLTRAGSEFDRNHADPYVTDLFVDMMSGRPLTEDQDDFLYYHGNSYFCGDRVIASNAGLPPLFARESPPPVHALFFQGMRDTLFTFNEAFNNYQCMRDAGGEVYLMSHQSGHNATPVVLDAGLRPVPFNPEQPGPPLNSYNSDCGERDLHDTSLAFFDRHFKGVGKEQPFLPKPVCVSLDQGDAIWLDTVVHGEAGQPIEIISTPVLAGVGGAPVVAEPSLVIDSADQVLAGIPELDVTLQAALPADTGVPIIFAGIGIMRANNPGIWQLADNQITPLRGTGEHRISMNGIGERLQAGDRVALLLYGSHDQYPYTGSVNGHEPTVMPVTVVGRLWLPVVRDTKTSAP
ncbi:ABC-2 type transport system ATP-binding protein [Litorivivens lipolytica]|uniref:ABC-2 type transport system ATP-binding protein n=1 Tax=Litorivivens lipolytica TaxID=1524264 RepID=A0A7W4W1Z2_9GAMM|nr:CocE/NonD family hydrolase [Litorivivens lipolytica]MBB3045825.1 ABC-2 type transport system ATP-binding protein [Litorivivens lipolytica]